MAVRFGPENSQIMKLIVFDLDGTLVKTNAVDEICFRQAFADSVGLPELDSNWLKYAHPTDSGITRQFFMEAFGREPEAEEIKKIVDRFLELLNEQHTIDPAQFDQVPGAASLLSSLEGNSKWGTAMATGCWRRSAAFKIQVSGLPLDGLPMAWAEDGPSREAIVRTAIARAAAWYQQSEFEKIVSVGDGLWDIRTAHRLNLPFLGVGEGWRAKLLRENGASHVIEDFLDASRFLHYLEEARIPAWRESVKEAG
ncbi:MAG: HAD family hydrolase [Thermodesulfobacteriota bacterium]